MALISDIFECIGQIYSPLNLANMKIQKLKFVWNTAPDNCRVLNFMGNPYWRISSHSAKIFLINIKSLYNKLGVSDLGNAISRQHD